MKKFLLAAGIIAQAAVSAQSTDPVKWQATYTPSKNNEGTIQIVATIDKGWHTYSQRPTDAGPIPTSIIFSPSAEVELVGKPEETGAHEEFVPAFEAKIYVFKDKAVFNQKVHRKKGSAATIPVKIEYMACNDMMCLPPKTVELKVQLPSLN